ncbi:hypothetical protein UCRPC4_g03973 [Phaeomoniella chlamydospora]|uniref:Uncharacterized protein n=1 Tax=Phaeomoniella chlamydospora TaxID=158046 RepID=A0A0G2EDD1_PHACM|nr:hypothetical protein UCRPC4_g03973 [Phaeomoniella chlamydospora]
MYQASARWPYVQELIKIFAQVVAFRDALLLSCPDTLDEALRDTDHIDVTNDESSPASTPTTASLSGSGEDSIRQEGWYQAITQVFNDQYVTKTLDLIVMRMILFCSGGPGLSREQALEGIKLSRKVVEVIDPLFTKAYVRKNPQRFAKIQKKIVAHVEPMIQLEALSFCLCLVGVERLSSQCLSILRDPRTALALFEANNPAFEELVFRGLTPPSRADGQAVHQTTLALIVPYLVDLCRPGRPSELETAKTLFLAVEICGKIQSALESSERLRNEMCAILGCSGVPDWWDIDPTIFCSPSGTGGSCHSSSICQKSVNGLRQKLGRDLSKIFLTVGWLCSTNSLQRQDALAVNKLVARVQQSISPLEQCTDGIIIPAWPLERSHVLPANTAPRNVSRDWKSTLKDVLDENFMATQQSFVNVMELICQDMEWRCENTKEPLRVVEAKLRDMNEELEHSTKRVRYLEDERSAMGAKTSEMAAEISVLKKQRIETEHRNDDIMQQLEQAQSQIESCRSENNALTQTVQETNAAQKLQKAEYDLKLKSAEAISSERGNVIFKLEGQIKLVSEEAKRLEVALAIANSGFSRQEKIYKEQISALQGENKKEKLSMQADSLRKQEFYQSELEIIKKELADSNEAAKLAAQHQENQLSKLVFKLEKAHKDKTALKRDLEKARDLKAKLAALMGGATQNLAEDSSDSEESTKFNEGLRINQSQ